MFAYIAQKSVEPVFNLDTNYFKPNGLKMFHYCQILKGINVTILQHKILLVWLLLIFFLSE